MTDHVSLDDLLLLGSRVLGACTEIHVEWTLEEGSLRGDSRGRYVSSLPALVTYLSMYLAQRAILRHDFGCCEQASRDSPLQWKRRAD